MSVTIKKNATLKEIKSVIKRIAGHKRKTIDVDRFFGKVKFGVDGLTYQKKIRDEWQ